MTAMQAPAGTGAATMEDLYARAEKLDVTPGWASTDLGRALIDAGVPVALATDFNPGSSPTPSMPLMIALATRTQGLSVAEAIVAATRNAACAVDRGERLGTLEVGKRCDVQLLDVPDYRYLGYGFGYNPVRQVLIGGEPQL